MEHHLRTHRPQGELSSRSILRRFLRHFVLTAWVIQDLMDAKLEGKTSWYRQEHPHDERIGTRAKFTTSPRPSSYIMYRASTVVIRSSRSVTGSIT